VTTQLEEKVKAGLGDTEYEADLEDPEAAGGDGEALSTQYYRTIPHWRCQPHVRPLPTEQIAAIWAAKDNRHRMGFLQQQAVKR